MNTRHTITMNINGRDVSRTVEARMTLVDFLRDELGLTGTHAGCEHGICGACTILLDGQAARSCLIFAVQANAKAVETVEGLSESGAISDLQQAFAQHHALQCGFCTPGMLIVAHDFLRTNPQATPDDISEAMSAVLCRCTGYWNILSAVQEVAVSEARRSVKNKNCPSRGAER